MPYPYPKLQRTVMGIEGRRLIETAPRAISRNLLWRGHDDEVDDVRRWVAKVSSGHSHAMKHNYYWLLSPVTAHRYTTLVQIEQDCDREAMASLPSSVQGVSASVTTIAHMRVEDNDDDESEAHKLVQSYLRIEKEAEEGRRKQHPQGVRSAGTTATPSKVKRRTMGGMHATTVAKENKRSSGNTSTNGATGQRLHFLATGKAMFASGR